MTVSITSEWKTRRIRVTIKTTKGKNDRMAFAATEKAKVWTSVCIKYLAVESIKPGDRRRARGVEGAVATAGLARVGVSGSLAGGLAMEDKSYQSGEKSQESGRTDCSGA